jgi:hypothetical protein
MQDEFSERAAREALEEMVLVHLREEPFLKATTRPEWLTLDGLVAALDAAEYWRGDGWTSGKPPFEPPSTSAGKRKHVREMLQVLSEYKDDDDPLASVDKVLVSTLRATDEGDMERVYKAAALCTAEELEELGQDSGAAADYHHIRARELDDARRSLQRGKGGLSMPEFYMQELSEDTMRRLWPNIDEEGRGWIVAVGIKLHFAQKRLVEQLKHEHQEGRTPTAEQVHENMVRGVDAMWDEIAKDLAHRLEVSEEAVKRFVDQWAIRFYSSEFAEALDNAAKDKFGWTLEEHLLFVAEERELD